MKLRKVEFFLYFFNNLTKELPRIEIRSRTRTERSVSEVREEWSDKEKLKEILMKFN